MRYLILFGLLVVIAVALVHWFRAKVGETLTLIFGVVLTVATVILFFVNKSDSVADTFLEKLADWSPPLITGSIVIGWWLGFVIGRKGMWFFR